METPPVPRCRNSLRSSRMLSWASATSPAASARRSAFRASARCASARLALRALLLVALWRASHDISRTGHATPTLLWGARVGRCIRPGRDRSRRASSLTLDSRSSRGDFLGRSRSTTLGGIRRRQPSVPIWNRRHRGGAHLPTRRYLRPRARWKRSAESYLLSPLPWVAVGLGREPAVTALRTSTTAVEHCRSTLLLW